MKELKKVPDLSIIFDMGVVALRFLMPVYAIIIVYQCFAAMRRRRRPETPPKHYATAKAAHLCVICL